MDSCQNMVFLKTRYLKFLMILKINRVQNLYYRLGIDKYSRFRPGTCWTLQTETLLRIRGRPYSPLFTCCNHTRQFQTIHHDLVELSPSHVQQTTHQTEEWRITFQEVLCCGLCSSHKLNLKIESQIWGSRALPKISPGQFPFQYLQPPGGA